MLPVCCSDAPELEVDHCADSVLHAKDFLTWEAHCRPGDSTQLEDNPAHTGSAAGVQMALSVVEQPGLGHCNDSPGTAVHATIFRHDVKTIDTCLTYSLVSCTHHVSIVSQVSKVQFSH